MVNIFHKNNKNPLKMRHIVVWTQYIKKNIMVDASVSASICIKCVIISILSHIYHINNNGSKYIPVS